MKVETFRGKTMGEALARVKHRLGMRAVILYTRTVRNPGLFGLLGRQMVEIAAVIDSDVPRPGRSDRKLRRTYNVSEPVKPGVAAGEGLSGFKQELAAVRTSLETLIRQTCPPDVADLPEALVEIYLDLVRRELSREISGGLIRQLAHEIDRTHCPDPYVLRQETLNRLAAMVTTSGPIGPPRAGRPRVVAMVGPTGVGKTTTIAKLSGDFSVRQGLRVGLVTIDTYRIAAVQQLKTIADIVQAPLRTVLTVGELQAALRGFADRDVVIIDTAGRCQQDGLRMNELHSFMAAAAADEIHLVMAATGRPGNLGRVLTSFRRVGVNRLLLTKLDEAEGAGAVFSMAARSGLPVSYITNGQDIPDDISVADGRTLAQMVLAAPGPEVTA